MRSPSVPLITSRSNPRVKQLRAAFHASPRPGAERIAIEGDLLLYEAVRSGLTPHTVFLDADHSLPAWIAPGTEILRLTASLFAQTVDTQAPQGIAALLEPPMWQPHRYLPDPARPATGTALFLVAAGLQDPGNLGTLIRSAEAFGATAVLITAGTVSPWNQKAMRASAGSVFRMPVLPSDGDALQALKDNGVRFLAAVSGDSAPHVSSAVPVHQLDLTHPCALLIGNEGAGLSPDLLALADTRITIPTPGPVESLNAAIAGSLLLYEASRQRSGQR